MMGGVASGSAPIGRRRNMDMIVGYDGRWTDGRPAGKAAASAKGRESVSVNSRGDA